MTLCGTLRLSDKRNPRGNNVFCTATLPPDMQQIQSRERYLLRRIYYAIVKTADAL